MMLPPSPVVKEISPIPHRPYRSVSVLESQQGDWVAARQRMQADLATARAKQQELTTRLHEEFSEETAAINRLKTKSVHQF